MLGITDPWTYLVGVIFIVLLPGPNSVFVLATAARRGVGDGYRAAAGVFAGDAVLAVLAASGAASLLSAVPALFTVLKFAGAAYLAWIGLALIASAWRRWIAGDDIVPRDEVERRADARSPFRRALWISLLNPKAILFFVSFFVQFVDPSYPDPALSFLALAVIGQAVSAVYLTVLIFAGVRLASTLRMRRRLAAGASGSAGAVFVGFAAKLAIASGA